LPTEVVTAPDEALVTRAVELLRAGEIVALPTETVYGLAADALNADAVAKVFAVKQRPRIDPLIVHLPVRDWLERTTRIREEDQELVQRLIDGFWPGPFTLVLPRRSIVPDIVTGGLETVAVRMSSHPIFSSVLAAFGRPLAAPSANRFGRVSPTTAQHVLDELGSHIPLVIDGGSTLLGLESTIVAVAKRRIFILRSGPVTAEQLSQYAEVEVITKVDQILAPGQMATHYAPQTPLRLIENANLFSPPEGQRVGLLAWRSAQTEGHYTAVRRLSDHQHLQEAAANLFRYLRELDALELDLIVAEHVPEQGLGAAIMDRLRRASGGR
jgi:L-threonylcarbamoyladenylate synthase